MTTADRQAVEAIVRQHGQNFIAQDAAAQVALFDEGYPGLTYLPTESDTYLSSFEQVRDYYVRVTKSFAPSAWRVEDLTIDFPAPDVAFALCRVFVDYTIHGPVSGGLLVPFHAPVGYWEGRCRYVMRQTPAGWRIIHYEDSTNENFRAGQLYSYHEAIAAELTERVQALRRPQA